MPNVENINLMLYALDDEDRGIEVILEGDNRLVEYGSDGGII